MKKRRPSERKIAKGEFHSSINFTTPAYVGGERNFQDQSMTRPTRSRLGCCEMDVCETDVRCSAMCAVLRGLMRYWCT